MKSKAVKLLQFGISGAILAWLVIDARGDATFSELASQPKHWGTLGVAWAFCMAAVLVTIVRWYYLVRALELPFTLRDALRLGFLGYLFNFVSLGTVGGDLFKAVFVAREHPGRRAEAVATVVLDRVIGLYGLFIVASVSIVVFGQLAAPSEDIRLICRATLAATVVGTLGVGVLLWPGFTQGRLSETIARLPRVGPTASKLLWAVRIYRSKPGVLTGSLVLSFGVHTLTTIGFYLISRGLPGEAPSLADHFIIVPLAMVTGVLPLPLNGLGAFEAVVDFLYRAVPAGMAMRRGQGLIVSLAFRVVTIVIALVGVCFYLGHRREVSEVLHTAEDEQRDEIDDHPAASTLATASTSG